MLRMGLRVQQPPAPASTFHRHPAALSDGGVFTRGRTWGEDLILGGIAPGLCRPTAAKALKGQTLDLHCRS